MQYEFYVASRNPAGDLTGDEVFVFLQGGVAVNGSLDEMMAYILEGIVIAPAFADITGDPEDNAALAAYVESEVTAAVVGLYDDRGNFDASVNAYPSSGGSGSAGAILKGDIWRISVVGTLPTGLAAHVGDSVRALVDTPGNTQANWSLSHEEVVPIVVGVQDLFIPASAMWPRVTNGCAPLAQSEIAGNNLNIQTLDFDQTTQEYAQFQLILPRKYNLSTLTYQAKWSSTVGSGAVTWGLQAVALADGDALSTSFGSAVDVNDAVGTADTNRLTAASAAVTIGNTPADADAVYFQVYRNPTDGSDNLAGDARLEGVWLHITTDAAIDA